MSMDPFASELIAGLWQTLDTNQRQQLCDNMDIEAAALLATGLNVASLQQLARLATTVSRQGLAAQELELDIDKKDIEKGQLNYKVEGNPQAIAYLALIATEMAQQGQQEFEKDPNFHMTAATIAAAQGLATELNEAGAMKIFENSRKAVEQFQPHTEDFAKATVDFYESLFSFIKRELKQRQEQAAANATSGEAAN